jgi:hypothetical protein
MGVNRVFFPQLALDEWLDEGKLQLEGDTLTLLPEGRRYRLTSALRFLAEVAEGTDPNDLVGKVKDQEQVAALEGEHCADSVVIGDNAYEVVEGFVAEALPAEAAAAASGSNLSSATRRAAGEKSTSSDDLDPLARFLAGR